MPRSIIRWSTLAVPKTFPSHGGSGGDSNSLLAEERRALIPTILFRSPGRLLFRIGSSPLSSRLCQRSGFARPGCAAVAAKQATASTATTTSAPRPRVRARFWTNAPSAARRPLGASLPLPPPRRRFRLPIEPTPAPHRLRFRLLCSQCVRITKSYAPPIEPQVKSRVRSGICESGPRRCHHAVKLWCNYGSKTVGEYTHPTNSRCS